VQPQLRFVHLLEDGLGHEDVEVGRQLQRRAKALDEGHGAGEWVGHSELPRRPPLEGEEFPDEDSYGRLVAMQYPHGRVIRFLYSSTTQALAQVQADLNVSGSCQGTPLVQNIQWEPSGALRGV